MQEVDWEKHTFINPEKKVKDVSLLNQWMASNAYKELISFFTHLQNAIKSKAISATPLNQKPAYLAFYKFFSALEALLTECPPIQQPMRFGNRAFTDWHKKLDGPIDALQEDLLDGPKKGAKIELALYLKESFGSEVRIDYGTGHELTFAIFQLCCCKLSIVDATIDAESIVRCIFYRYIRLMRTIQELYFLEPAGSHGVWGQDDYHFLPFLLGGSELVDHQHVSIPDDIHKDWLLEKYKDDFMYLNCIAFIKKVKKGCTFQESSPMLNDISAAASWTKVANGMVKMYQAECLNKFPIVQHLRFGSLFTFV